MFEELSGKNYIVTGASSGIGRAVCVELSKLKANAVLVARNEERLQETLAKMEPANHTSFIYDLTDIDGIAGLVEQIYEANISIDGIIYCAGYSTKSPLSKAKYDVLHKDMLISYYAFVEVVRCVIKHKPKQHSMRIVGMSSVASVLSPAYYLPYSAAKAALEAAVRVMSTELISKATTINAIRPAYVDTEMIHTLGFHDFYGDFNKHIMSVSKFQPLGLIEASDVAKMAVYLVGDAAKSITGMTFTINGGARV